MPHGNTLSRILIAMLAAVIIATPTAMAQPTDPVGPAEQPQTQAPANGDLRGEAAAAPQAKSETAQELRTEAAKDGSRAPATKPVPEAPAWPMHPRVLTPPQSTTTVADDGDGGGVDAPIVALIIAGALALAGGLTVAMHRRSTPVAH